MVKYLIEYDRSGCISAISCAAVQPQRWVIAEDGKADLVGGKKTVGNKEIFETEINEEELKETMDAIEVCPARIIRLYKINETGEKVLVHEAK